MTIAMPAGFARSLGKEQGLRSSFDGHREIALLGMRIYRQIFCLKILIPFVGLLRDIQAEIEKRSLSDGGWASRNGRTAAVETTCYALMALPDGQSPARDKAINQLIRMQNADGSWPAFEGDDRKGCWTTSLALIALRFLRLWVEPAKGIEWLLNNKGCEGHWFWKWKFRTVDRAVEFNPDKYGWSWFPDTVSWVIPTALSVIALKQSRSSHPTEQLADRIQLGTEMLRDRACPQGGWNAGNGIVFGAALTPHLDTTATALLALKADADPTAIQGLHWLRGASAECSSAYSLAWSTLAFLVYQDQALDRSTAKLFQAIFSKASISNVETLSLAAIAIKSTEGHANPFQV